MLHRPVEVTVGSRRLDGFEKVQVSARFQPEADSQAQSIAGVLTSRVAAQPF